MKTTPAAPVPAGHIRHPVTGCILPDVPGAVAMHEHALAQRQASHTRSAERTPESMNAAVRAKLAELEATHAELDATLAEVKALRQKVAAEAAAAATPPVQVA